MSPMVFVFGMFLVAFIHVTAVPLMRTEDGRRTRAIISNGDAAAAPLMRTKDGRRTRAISSNGDAASAPLMRTKDGRRMRVISNNGDVSMRLKQVDLARADELRSSRAAAKARNETNACCTRCSARRDCDKEALWERLRL